MNETAPRKFGMGAAPRRVEDMALVTGRGRFTDDIEPPGTLRALMIRSEMGHARFTIGGLDEARALPGVHLVWTAADLGYVGDLPATSIPRNRDGTIPDPTPRPVLNTEVARHVGDPIGLIVADDAGAARRALEALAIDYEPLPAAIDMKAALEPGAPLVWPERGTNLAFDFGSGDFKAVDAAFSRAARTVRLELVNNRLVANYMEPRGIIAEYDAGDGRWTITLGTQGGHGIRDLIAEDILHVPAERIRVITPDVGGGFGPKAFTYSEYPAVMLAAQALGRPVKWIGDRTEHFLADGQGRDQISVGEMALDGKGRFLALRVDTLVNVGAYFAEYGPAVVPGAAGLVAGLYDIPVACSRIRGVFTNTVPTEAYRGAGRPEAAYLIERLVDLCGREAGIDVLDIRRRNFVPQEKMPYRSAGGRTYDSGDFVGHFERALEAADHAGFPARRAESAARGKYRGFGVGCYIEACAFPGDEPATVRLNEDGTVTLFIGTQSNGQGHATAYAQFIVGHLGLAYEQVSVVQGDTDQVLQGGGTAGSRSVPIGAVSVDRAAATLAVKVKALAAPALDAAPEQLDISDGLVRVVDGNRSMSLREVTALAGAARLEATENYRQPVATYPNGTHVCELEIDPETGTTEILRYTVVDDFGATVNPVLLAGQVHGGIVQGIGQALMERTVYDPDGQLLSASFLDYAMPRAESIPNFHFETRNIPCKTNPLGIKGAGEAGTVGACGAVINGIVDALAGPLGITAVDMPATPSLLWAAMEEARGRSRPMPGG